MNAPSLISLICDDLNNFISISLHSLIYTAFRDFNFRFILTPYIALLFK